MVKRIIQSFKGEVNDFEKKKFNERRDLENVMFLLEERANALKIRQLISIELFEDCCYRLRKKYCEERAKLQQKESGEAPQNDSLVTDRDKQRLSCLEGNKNGTSSMSSWRERLTVAGDGNKADKQVKDKGKDGSEFKKF